MNDDIGKFIDELRVPQSVREELKKKYSSKAVRMSSKDGRKAMIILWEDEAVSVISTDKNGEPHISTTNSPDQYYIAIKHYESLGLIIEAG